MRFLSSVRNSEFAAYVLILFVISAFSRGLCFPVQAQPRPAPLRMIRPTVQANPVQVRAEIKALLLTQPHEVFALLNNTRTMHLAPAERMDLARQAAARLASRIEASNNPWVTLTEVDPANQIAEGFASDIRDDMQVLVCLAERRALEDAVFEVHHLAERGRWGDVVRRGQEWQKRLNGLGQVGRDQRTTKTRNEVQAALTGIIRIGLERQAVADLQEGLRAGKLDKVAVANLPPRLRDSVQGWRGFQVVRQLAEESRLNAQEIATLKERLAYFAKSLVLVPESEATLPNQILQDLAVRHFLQGHPAEYRALMPSDGSADRAAELLRDMKALALGKGEVGTTPARQALSAEAGKKGDPPPGVQALLPEGTRKGWRPPAGGGARTKPTALDKGIVIADALRAVIEKDLRKERITQTEKATEAQARLETAQRHLREQEEADGKRLTEVETALGRPLETMEKVRVRQLAARNQTNRQIVETVQAQANAKAPRH